MQKANSRAKNYEVLALGDPYVDRILRVNEEFLHSVPGEKGGTLEITYPTLVALVSTAESEPEIIPGGSAANMLRGLAHLGHSCALLGKIGNDDLAEYFLKSLEGLPIHPLLTEVDLPTGQVVCLVTPDGDRTQRTLVGSAGAMRPDEVEEEHFDDVRLVHIEGYTLRNGELPRHSAKLAKAAGCMVSMDLAAFELVERYQDLVTDLVKNYVDILFCNSLEAEALTGRAPEHAVSVIAEHCDVAVVTMGASGCWVQSGADKHYCPTDPVTPMDSTGAGDLFSAGFLYGWLNGAQLPECARMGALVARQVIQGLGPQISRRRWQELKAEVQEILLSSLNVEAQ